jgi:glycosyltransferase involved in cell wall biosynthesis
MGMGHYERFLIHNLIKETQAPHGDWKFSITFDGRTPPHPVTPDSVEPGLGCVDFLGISTCRFQNTPWRVTQACLNRRFRNNKARLYHSLALSYPPPDNRPAVLSIHDLPPARFPDEGLLPAWSKKVARAAAAILTPSQFARGELIELLDVAPERVHVVPYGCEHDRFHPAIPAADADTLARYGITTPFIIYVGGFTRRKNVPNLLAAWRAVEAHYPELSLVMVGPEEPLRSLARDAGAPRVVVPGYMGLDTLPPVIKAATALVFPSIYEGFGIHHRKRWRWACP